MFIVCCLIVAYNFTIHVLQCCLYRRVVQERGLRWLLESETCLDTETLHFNSDTVQANHKLLLLQTSSIVSFQLKETAICDMRPEALFQSHRKIKSLQQPSSIFAFPLLLISFSWFCLVFSLFSTLSANKRCNDKPWIRCRRSVRSSVLFVGSENIMWVLWTQTSTTGQALRKSGKLT